MGGKYIGKNILSSKYSQELHDHTKQSATDVLAIASKRAIKLVIKLQTILRKSQNVHNKIN